MIRRTLAALTAAAICLATPATAAKTANAGEGMPSPVQAGPLAPVTGETGYAAFPDTIARPDGSLLAAYRNGSGHASADGKVRFRRSIDGDVWTEWVELDTPAGYAYGPAGLASETAAQGGRLYLTVTRYTSTGPNSGTDFRPYLTRSDDGGRTWTGLTSLPEPVAGWTYPSGVLVLADGSVLVSAYVRNASTGRWSAHYWKSTNRGDTWTPFGVLTHASRNLQEPQLVQLDNGRVLTALRSDSPGVYYDYIYTATLDPGTGVWTTPAAAVTNATGNPQLAKLPSGHVVLTYRGYGQPGEATDPNTHPLRVAMLLPDGSKVYRGGVDILADRRRYLYGNLVPVVGGYRLVVSLEESASAARVFSVPVRFGLIPPW